MSLVVTGIIFIATSLAIRIAGVVAMRRSGRPAPWKWVFRAPMLWAGVVLVIGGINETAGAIALAVGAVVLTAHLLRMLINAPTSTRRAWHQIGDPAAWRGEPTPDAGVKRAYFGGLLWHKIALGLMAILVLVLIATLIAPR